ncbi:MAG: putative deacylase [Gammaproteobacteria bacterium]|jgi:predicted deacylase
MAFEKIVRILHGDSPGTSTELSYYRIGPESATTKVYLQGALHADEQPGILILHHLLKLLKAADEAGHLNAVFVVFPMVNPLGMANLTMQKHQGRYDANSGINFNRGWPNVFSAMDLDLSKLPEGNGVDAVQAAQNQVKSWIDDLPESTAREAWRKIILSESYDADYCFDLHCDDDALIHIYAVPQIADDMHKLAEWTGSAATLLAEDSGGGSFDEVWPGFWINLNRETGADFQITRACTLEYRGNFEVFDGLNENDALNLYGYFHAEGLIEGESSATRKRVDEPVDLRAMEYLRSDLAGLIAYQVELGALVKKGAVIAEMIVLDGEQAFVKRTPIFAGTDGVLFARSVGKYVWAGAIIAKIAGRELLVERGGYLLGD